MDRYMMDASLEEICCGYRLDEQRQAYTCLFCGEVFDQGYLYPVGERIADASKAAERHILEAHGSPFEMLLQEEKKVTGLTPVQRDLLSRFYRGETDKEIARATGTSLSTVRYQRYSFREKAKQAKSILALSHMLEKKLDRKAGDEIKIHPGATMVDERYMITEEEAQKVINTYFASRNPLRLSHFPPKEKKKLVILREIAGAFQAGRTYTEKEINQILGPIFEDYATLRRYLIEYGFMDRSTGGKAYWIK